MLHAVALMLATLGSPDAPKFDASGGRVVVYGSSAPKSRKAQNKWDRLNLSPQGVEPAPLAKRL